MRQSKAPARMPLRRGPTASGLLWPEMANQSDAQALALATQIGRTEWWSPEKLIGHQLRQADVLLRHAAKTVRFHRERLSEFVCAVPLGGLTMDAFRTLPIMTRADIQNAGEALNSRAVPAAHGKTFPVRSSGSTGRPIEVLGTAITSLYASAFTMRGHVWHGRDLDAKNVDIRTGSLPAKHRRRARWSALPGTGRSVYIDIALPIDKIFTRLIDEDPAYVQTHPSTLLGLVEHSKEVGRMPASLREARTFGEALEPNVRKIISQTWNVPVVDNYSANEIGTIAHQCPTSTALHIQSESVLVEILDNAGNPCPPTETGKVVITVLHNFATPLIRYEIGDYATVGEACRCGRGLPVLTRVLGRERNLLVYPDGRKRFPDIRIGGFEQVGPLRQWQLIQRSVEDLDLRLVVASDFTENEENAARDFLLKKFGYPFNINIEYHDHLPRAANGKFEEFISEVG